MLTHGSTMTDGEVDAFLETPEGRQLAEMMKHRAIGTPAQVAAELRRFARLADADELMVVPAGRSAAGRIESVDRLADGWQSADAVEEPGCSSSPTIPGSFVS